LTLAGFAGERALYRIQVGRGRRKSGEELLKFGGVQARGG
jgi:hypothetical protein